MSVSKSFLTFSFLPPPDSQPSNSSETRKSISLSSSSYLATLNQNRLLVNCLRPKKYYTSQRKFLVHSFVQPGAPPPSEPPSNILNWILGFAITVVLPFFSGKWTSLLRIKNEVETAVQIGEDIVKAVGKAAEKVEKAAEKAAEDLPKDGGLRKVVDFVEHVAEITNKDAHIVGDIIDKVQEVEEKVEDYVESIVEGSINHEHHKKDDQENGEEDRGEEQTKLEEDEEDNQENEAQEEEKDRGQEEAKLEEEDNN